MQLHGPRKDQKNAFCGLDAMVIFKKYLQVSNSNNYEVQRYCLNVNMQIIVKIILLDGIAIHIKTAYNRLQYFNLY